MYQSNIIPISLLHPIVQSIFILEPLKYFGPIGFCFNHLIYFINQLERAKKKGIGHASIPRIIWGFGASAWGEDEEDPFLNRNAIEKTLVSINQSKCLPSLAQPNVFVFLFAFLFFGTFFTEPEVEVAGRRRSPTTQADAVWLMAGVVFLHACVALCAVATPGEESARAASRRGTTQEGDATQTTS